MARAPEFFTDIANKSREVLFSGYDTGVGIIRFASPKFWGHDNGFISSGKIAWNSFSAGTKARFKKNNITTHVNVDPSAGLFATVAVDKIVPGLKTIFNFNPTHQKFGDMKLRYQHDNYTAISTSLELPTDPTINFSGLVTTKTPAFERSSISIGTDISLNTATNEFTKYDIGLEFVTPDYRFSLVVNDKIHTKTGSFFVHLDSTTALSYQIFNDMYYRNASHFIIGTQHTLDPRTLVKFQTTVRSSDVAVRASLTHTWLPNCSITISGVTSVTKPPETWQRPSNVHLKYGIPPSTPFSATDVSSSMWPRQQDPSTRFGQNDTTSTTPNIADTSVPFDASFLLQRVNGPDDNLAILPRLKSMTWTMKNQKSKPTEKISVISLKLHDYTKSPAGEREVKFQLNKDTLEAMLKSMTYIGNQLSNTGGSSSGPLQKRPRI